MKISHFKEEHIYVVSNHAVARNPIFGNEAIKKYFIEKMDYYLAPIADLLGFNLANHEFQIIVKLKNRNDFINFYKSRERYEEEEIIPESTYIFSRAMSNLQVSLVKKFNFLFHREGTLIATRFGREQIAGIEELHDWIQRMNMGKTAHKYKGIWNCEIMNDLEAMTSKELYSVDNEGRTNNLSCFLNGLNSDLVGYFKFDCNSIKFPPIYFHYRHFTKALLHFQV